MIAQSRIITFGLWLAVSSMASSAMAAGAVERGRALAEQWCAQCHAIGDAAVQTDTPPAFSAIVAERGRDADWIAAWLVTPHQNMPDLALTGQEIDDLIAYMESLQAAN